MESSQSSISPSFAAFDLRVPSPGWAGMAGVGEAANRLTDKILGNNSDDLVDILKAVASEIGLSHVSFVRFASNRSWDVSLLLAVATYSKLWQIRYFLRRYGAIDPVIKRGSVAVLPFDWETLHSDEPATVKFFADAARHGVGRNGLSIPVRNRKNTHSLISFTSDIPKQEWGIFKQSNMTYLQQLSALIDSAAGIDFKATPEHRSAVAARGTMPSLGCEGKDIPGDCRYIELKLGEREDALGYRAPQAALHKFDPRRRRRGGDRRYPDHRVER